MLRSIYIKNIALIDERSMEFTQGLNILSGETGAGKSIIIDSLNFVLGERADKDLIKTGTVQGLVEAVFDVTGAEEILNEYGIEDELVIIKRTLNIEGKSECRINGKIVTLNMLKDITAKLADIHGQHAHQSILKTANHIKIADNYNKKINILLEPYRKSLSELKDIENNIEKLGGDGFVREQKLEFLKFQLEELKKASLQEGEEEELRNLRSKIINSEKIYENLKTAKNSLSSDDGAYVQVKSAVRNLQNIEKYLSDITSLEERLDNILIELDDISETLYDYLQDVSFNENELDKVEDRLSLINKLKRKYNKTSDELISYYDDLKKEFEELSDAESLIEILKSKKLKTEKIIEQYCSEITSCRTESAAELEINVKKELDDLGLKGSKFKVSIEKTDNFTANGNNELEFLFSANMGEPLKPLTKVISGGEMSRFMLALKNTASDETDCLVFDEIDTGLSGKMGQVLAEKLQKISEKHQVICITHLPQVAAMADTHYVIKKFLDGEKTVTAVEKLNYEGRLREIVRLMGAEQTENSLGAAREMLQRSETLKIK